MLFKYAGDFENAAIYETSLFTNGTGLTIPNFGIIVSKGAYTEGLDQWLIKHEYGHILQKEKHGHFKFYTQIATKSLWSATKQSILKNHLHALHPVELNANQLAYEYFNKPADWPIKRFPLNAF